MMLSVNHGITFKDDSDRDHFIADLRMAGLSMKNLVIIDAHILVEIAVSNY